MNANFRIAALLLSVAAMATDAVGYEMPTHEIITKTAFGASNLANEALHRRLGIQRLMGDATFLSSQEQIDRDFLLVGPSCDPRVSMGLERLLACGAMYEDVPGPRSLNHFFDPEHEGSPLTVYGSLPGGFLGYPNFSSPDWSLEDVEPIGEQEYSYRDARLLFYLAATRQGIASVRDGLWGDLFETLGHVVHHIQDMAQPQHTRNDPHSDFLSGNLLDSHLGQLRHPSRFEKYARVGRGESKVSELVAQDIAPVFPKFPGFKRPRDFWSSAAGTGLADFSNRNFLSHGTNYIANESGVAASNPRFSMPAPYAMVTMPIEQAIAPDTLPASLRALCNEGLFQDCAMRFYSNQWTDPLTGLPDENLRGSTESIFDEDLVAMGAAVYPSELGDVATRKVFSLNYLNFDAALNHLIPKAVAYSAGLLNFFFRGDMTINLPATGVYSFVDHSAARCINACGFSKIRLTLTNITPGEAMRSGTLVAVAKYYRNTCYKQDLSGDPGGPNFYGIECQSGSEEALASREIRSVDLQSGESREFAFDFDVPIPINATDLSLQVVFRGVLGEEDGAVALTTKDIAEPNFVSLANVTDMVYHPEIDRFRALPDTPYTTPDLIKDVSLTFKEGGQPVATIAQLSAPGHAQIAFLTDPGSQYINLAYKSARYTVGDTRGQYAVSEFIGDVESGIYGRSVAFRSSRGMGRNIHFFHRLPPDWALNNCKAEPEMCAQTTMPSFFPETATPWTLLIN